MMTRRDIQDGARVVIVLGARSGTSALAGTLGMLGCTLPKRLMGACSSSNEKGHFEPAVIASLHDSLLAEAGSAWDDWRPFPPGWYGTAACTEYMDRLQAAFAEDYGGFSLAVLKEPRMCRLLPLWWRLLDRVGAQAAPVFIYRDPVEVAQSLAARDASTMLHGLLYWLRNQLDSEFFTRGMTRSFVLFDELLEDWRSVAGRLQSEHGIRFPGLNAPGGPVCAEVDAFLEPRLRHQRRLGPAVVGADVLTGWAQSVFGLFNTLRAAPANPGAPQELDRIRAAFNRYTSSRALEDAATQDARLLLS